MNKGLSFNTPHPQLACPIPEQSSKQQPLESLEAGLKCYLISLLGAVKQQNMFPSSVQDTGRGQSGEKRIQRKMKKREK